MKLLETLTTMGKNHVKQETPERKKEKSVISTPSLLVQERIDDTPVGHSNVSIYGHKEGTQEYFDMVEELEYLKKYDFDLYRKIMSLD